MLIAIHSMGNYRESTKAQPLTVKATEQRSLSHYNMIKFTNIDQQEDAVGVFRDAEPVFWVSYVRLIRFSITFCPINTFW